MNNDDSDEYLEVCGESHDHELRVIDQRDGMISLECTRCGAEIFYEGDEW